jgi:hypothetical protein
VKWAEIYEKHTKLRVRLGEKEGDAYLRLASGVPWVNEMHTIFLWGVSKLSTPP